MKTEPTEAYRMIEEDWYAIPYMGMDYPQDPDIVVDKEDVYEIAKIAFQEGQSNPKIRQLEWEEYRDCLVSTTPFYNVSIKEVCGIYELATAYSAFIKSYNSLDEAKAAAQRDFEKRVKECLE
jgi:hypothetical protein